MHGADQLVFSACSAWCLKSISLTVSGRDLELTWPLCGTGLMMPDLGSLFIQDVCCGAVFILQIRISTIYKCWKTQFVYIPCHTSRSFDCSFLSLCKWSIWPYVWCRLMSTKHKYAKLSSFRLHVPGENTVVVDMTPDVSCLSSWVNKLCMSARDTDSTHFSWVQEDTCAFC